jgi:hypothetical protein
MVLIRLSFIALHLFIMASAWAAKPQLSVDLDQYGKNLSSENRQLSIWGALASWKLNYAPTKYLTEEINVSTQVETGSFRSRYTDSGKSYSGIDVYEAKINFLANDYLKLSIGAQSLGYFSAPMIFATNSTSSSFAALSEELLVPIENWKWKIFAWQTLPRANSSDLGLISFGPRDSFLFIGGTRLSADGDFLKVNMNYFYFYYSHLFNSVAYVSQFDGNSVSGIGTNTTSFIYDYQGHHASFDWEVNPLGDFSFKQKLSYLFNEKAPNHFNSGLMLDNTFKIYDWFFTGTLFKIKRDAAVAYYNSSSIGHTNREGFKAEIATMVPSIGGKMALDYSKRNTIEKNIYQSNEQRVSFTWSQNFNLF